MFPPPRPSSPRQRSASCSTDDKSSTKDRPRRLVHRHYLHDLGISSHSLAALDDDLPTPSMPTHVRHSTSTHSTPMTSPSTAYSSPLPGSLSSATSESAPSPDSKYRSDFGILIPNSSTYSSLLGSAHSRASHPVSPWSRSTSESDPRSSAPHIPSKHSSAHLSIRPFTPPNSPPILAAPSATDSAPADHHSRSHSRLTEGIKNLFSRHIGHSPSRFSLNSVTPPDSQVSSSSFHVPAAAAGKWSLTPRKSRPPDLEISGTVTPPIPSPSRNSNPPLDAHRRYPSEAISKIDSSRTGTAMQSSQDGIDTAFRNAVPVRTRDPKTRNVLRRRPSGSAKLFRGRERGMSSPSIHSNQSHPDAVCPSPKEGRQGRPPFPLTPAGAVVEAYKQQELHRDDTPSPPKLSIDGQMSSTPSYEGGHDRDHPKDSPTPYYTVFGSSSERRVHAGGPDDWCGTFTPDQRIFHPPPSLHQPTMSDPGTRSLSRKLSNRWRKVKEAGVAPEESPLRDRGHSKGRPSLHELWAGDTRPTGRSIDVVNPAEGPWASPSMGHGRTESKGDKNEGPKLWQLMRRISTGGLRDRFQTDKAAPPVPAIPKDLLKKANQTDRSHDASRHCPPSTSHDKDPSRMSTEPCGIARPSVATCSSSPNSSDVASAQFFQKTHSSRSSVSSYGEAVVSRVRETVLDRRIIAPLEQLRLADDHVECRAPSIASLPRSTSLPAGLATEAEGDHLQLRSPRHQTCPGEPPSTGSSRPCSTALSLSGSYQGSGAMPGHARMADGIVSLSPPPRPSRHLTRGGSGSIAGSPSHSMVVKQEGSIGIGGARQMDRTPSAQSDMTARVESPEGDARRPNMFRELNAPRRPPLSEREKTDIWNDLLARSDKAGGTLHINGTAELMSDSMRLSTYSEA